MTYPIEYLAEPYELIDRPLWWHRRGLQQTASGYGGKLTSRNVCRFWDAKNGTVREITRRVYVTCYSNAGSAWIIVGKRRLFLR